MDLSNWIALAAAATATYSLWHTIKVEKRFTKDERVMAGRLKHPEVNLLAHRQPVLVTRLVNLGRRRAVVTKVEAQERLGNVLDIDWSDEIDANGNPLRQRDLCLADPVVDIFIRRKDGVVQTDKTVVQIWHSQSEEPVRLTFNVEHL